MPVEVIRGYLSAGCGWMLVGYRCDLGSIWALGPSLWWQDMALYWKMSENWRFVESTSRYDANNQTCRFGDLKYYRGCKLFSVFHFNRRKLKFTVSLDYFVVQMCLPIEARKFFDQIDGRSCFRVFDETIKQRRPLQNSIVCSGNCCIKQCPNVLKGPQ